MHIPTILMKWAITNKKWDIVLCLYTMLNIGIPNSYLYSHFPHKSKFTTEEAIDNGSNVVLDTNDTACKTMICLFPVSTYGRLEEWNGMFGYRRR